MRGKQPEPGASGAGRRRAPAEAGGAERRARSGGEFAEA